MEYKTKEQVIEQANKLVNKSLSDILIVDELSAIKEKLINYGTKRKGYLGNLVEEFHFDIKPNNDSNPDFKDAEVELKCTPLKRHSVKKYVSKERLVFSMINYDKIINEKWKTSSFLKKNKVLLILFYLFEKNVPIFDYKFKYSYLLNLLEGISNQDILQIQKDWEYIVNKINNGEAHLLSEADTYYLGACTKAANKLILRDQPKSKESAKPRAFSLKQKYLNFIIQKYLLKKNISSESIFKSNDSIKTIEEVVVKKFKRYIGKTNIEIEKKLNLKIKRYSKNYTRYLINRIFGVKTNKIEELEKADITMKVITLEYTGNLKESLSFPAFNYKNLVIQTWYNERRGEIADFHALLETQKFLFVVFQKAKNGKELVLKKIKFWNFPMSDLSEAERVWKATINCVNQGNYEKLPKISDSHLAHVRPHAKNSQDTQETPQGTQEIKRSFWLNAKYVQKVLS